MFHSPLKTSPLSTRPPIIKKEMGTILIWRIHSVAGPMVMRNHLRQRNSVLVHQVCSELGSTVNCPAATVAFVLTHFESDRILVTGTIEISVSAGNVCWQMLNSKVLVDGIMPCEMPKLAPFQGERVPPRICSLAPVLSAVDGDIARTH